ncbi:hypothetical protein C8J56DRAFT_1055690 [Mycena floridula]|nr:hypothetical protein C8J56DRAFT_1055690 [Mycena floridula]
MSVFSLETILVVQLLSIDVSVDLLFSLLQLTLSLVVEVTGASSGSAIRERIYAKLYIPDDKHKLFRIYQSQIGALSMSGALTDASIFEVCQRHGDPAGSLVFFVSTAPDRPPTNFIQPDAQFYFPPARY